MPLLLYHIMKHNKGARNIVSYQMLLAPSHALLPREKYLVFFPLQVDLGGYPKAILRTSTKNNILHDITCFWMNSAPNL